MLNHVLEINKAYSWPMYLIDLLDRWNPEKDSVEILKNEFVKLGGVYTAQAYCTSVEDELGVTNFKISEKFVTVVEKMWGMGVEILSCDADGFCLIEDGEEIKHIKHLEDSK